MLLFFATIGAGAGSLSALKGTGWLTAFITIQLAVHMAIILLGGNVIAKLPMQVNAVRDFFSVLHCCTSMQSYQVVLPCCTRLQSYQVV